LAEFLSGWLGLTLLLATVALSLYLVQVSSVATAGYELQRLGVERDGWLARNQQLELELAKRRSLAWVEAQAGERLGLTRPERPPVVIQVEPHDTVSQARPARGSQSGQVSLVAVDAKARDARLGPGDLSPAVDALQWWIASLVYR
jgi:hypothetical protein